MLAPRSLDRTVCLSGSEVFWSRYWLRQAQLTADDGRCEWMEAELVEAPAGIKLLHGKQMAEFVKVPWTDTSNAVELFYCAEGATFLAIGNDALGQ